MFKTPTSFVSATKVKRYYTPEQQADLDIKTSVNKIGEIINLSQELNSLLWDRMYHGASYDEIKELYYDICQLDIMSGLEIDSAKKEFVINNSKELDKLRQKYEPVFREYEEDENGKPVKGRKKIPHFFSHISRQKGYYNPDKKHYCKYHTTMDYLQTIVNGFRVKSSYKKNWLPFVAILNNSKYYSSHVNQKQINKIYSMLKKYFSDRTNIYLNESNSFEEQKEKIHKLKSDLISEIENERIGFSTLYRLLSSIENKENANIKHLLLSVLFLCGSDSFNKAILQSSDDVLQLQDNGEDIYLFGIGYKLTRLTLN